MAPMRFPGSVCRYRLLPEIDSGTLCRQPSASPRSTDGLSLWPELFMPGFLPAALGMSTAITDADKAEFEIIKKMPVYDSRRRKYRTANSYVSDRTMYFGSPSAYTAFAAESDAELLNTKWVTRKRTFTLQSMVEFDKRSQSKQQLIFYRWVRKAYKRKYGEDVNVPELIRKGMSEKLADEIKAVRGSIRVKEAHQEQFHAGGFNPRPIKYDHHYLLGTLSEHATGMAVDLDDNQNPQLTVPEWEFIEKLVGKSVARSGRWKTEADAEALWKDIKEVSDLFVKKTASEVRRIDKERADKEKAAKAPAPAKKAITPLEEVLGTHFSSLSRWTTTGFLHLPLELVLELHAHGFTWGATFSSNVDLHHFQIDE
jgi:hypothetical protein